MTFSLSRPPPSTRGFRCLVDKELNEHCPCQREVLFAYVNFSLSTPPFSTRGSCFVVDNELKEHCVPQREVHFAISLFLSLLAHPEREVLVVSLRTSSTSTGPSKRSSFCVFQFFPLSSPILKERFSLWSLTTSSRSTAALKEEFSLPISLFPFLVLHPQREVVVVLLTKSSTSTAPIKEKFALPISLFPLFSPTLNERFSLSR